MATIGLAVANDHELDIRSTMMYRHVDYLAAYAYIAQNWESTMKVIINVQESDRHCDGGSKYESDR